MRIKLISTLSTIALLIVAIELILLPVIIAYGARYLEIAGDSPEAADAIVVLGGATGDRISIGLRLWKKGFSDTILITGSPDGTSPYYNDWREYVLLKHGMKPEKIIKDSSAKSSWDEAVLIKKIMGIQDWHRVLIVSDPPHTRRLMMTYRRVFEGTDYDYRIIKTTPAWWNAERWWENTASGSFVLMELIKLTYYYFGKY
jgi:uncharacterized SAM-binding protein YcdF (DUF218 family)